MYIIITSSGTLLSDWQEISQRYSPALADLVLGSLPQNQSEDGILVKDTIRAEGKEEEE